MAEVLAVVVIHLTKMELQELLILAVVLVEQVVMASRAATAAQAS